MTLRQRTPVPGPAQGGGAKRPRLPAVETGRPVGLDAFAARGYQREIDDYLSGNSGYPAIVLSHEWYAYAKQEVLRMETEKLVEVDFRPGIEGELGRMKWLVDSLSPPSAEDARDDFSRWSDLLHAGHMAPETPLVFCKGLDALDENETGMLRSALDIRTIRLVADYVHYEQIRQLSPAVASPLTLCLHWIGDPPPKSLSAERKTALERIAREVIERIAAGRAKGERVLINIHGPSGSGKTSMGTMIMIASTGMPFPIRGSVILSGGVEDPVMAGCNPDIVAVLDEASRFTAMALGYTIGRFPWLVLLTHQPIGTIKPEDRIDLGDPKLPK